MGLHPSISWVRRRIRECIPCQKFHRPQPTTDFGEWHEVGRPGEVIGIDFMGPFPERKVGKKRFILVVIDRLTRFGQATTFRNARSREIILGLEHWVKSRGYQRVLCADVAQATRSHELKAWCKEKTSFRNFLPLITIPQSDLWSVSIRRYSTD